jgi:ribosome silencing factor RsfS/YbeB/iojap
MLARWRLINPLLIGNITSLTPAVSSIHNRSLTKRDLCVGSSSDGEDGPSQYDIESLLKNIHNERKARHKKEEKKIIREKRQDIFTIDALVNFLKEENAQEICVIKVPDDLQYVSYFVTCTAVSGRHIQRIAEAICYQMKKFKILNNQRITIEGEDSEDWAAVDLGNSVVHIMSQETRDKYQLETLWSLGHSYDDRTQEMIAFNDQINKL